MATLSQAKTLGGVGSILVFIPFVSIVGYILVVIAVKEISDDLHDSTIFNNLLIAAVTGIVGALAGAFFVVFGAFSAVATFSISGFLGVITGLLIVWIALIISAIFLKRAYDTMGQKLGVGMFKTAATLYLVGAALTIVLVGFLLLFIGQIVQAVAYFSIPEQLPAQAGTGAPSPMAAPPASMSPQVGATKFCVSCGNKLAATATFCNSCGAKQP
jgi:uncharacterized membrane protein